MQQRLLKEARDTFARETAARREHARDAAAQQQHGGGGGCDGASEGGAPCSEEGSVDDAIARVVAAAPSCPYKCLGVPVHASREMCRRSYLQLALKLHPDKCSHPRAKEAFSAVEAAFRSVEARGT